MADAGQDQAIPGSREGGGVLGGTGPLGTRRRRASAPNPVRRLPLSPSQPSFLPAAPSPAFLSGMTGAANDGTEGLAPVIFAHRTRHSFDVVRSPPPPSPASSSPMASPARLSPGGTTVVDDRLKRPLRSPAREKKESIVSGTALTPPPIPLSLRRSFEAERRVSHALSLDPLVLSHAHPPASPIIPPSHSHSQSTLSRPHPSPALNPLPLPFPPAQPFQSNQPSRYPPVPPSQRIGGYTREESEAGPLAALAALSPPLRPVQLATARQHTSELYMAPLTHVSLPNILRVLFTRLFFFGFPKEYVVRTITAYMAQNQDLGWSKFKHDLKADNTALGVVSTLLLGAASQLLSASTTKAGRTCILASLLCSLFSLATGTAILWRVQTTQHAAVRSFADRHPSTFPLLLALPVVYLSWSGIAFLAAILVLIFHTSEELFTGGIAPRLPIALIAFVGLVSFAFLTHELIPIAHDDPLGLATASTQLPTLSSFKPSEPYEPDQPSPADVRAPLPTHQETKEPEPTFRPRKRRPPSLHGLGLNF